MKVRYEVCTMPGGRRSNQDRWVVGRSVVEEREKTSGVWDTEVEPLLTAVLDGVGGCVYSELGKLGYSQRAWGDLLYSHRRGPQRERKTGRGLQQSGAGGDRNQPLQLCGSHHPDSGGFCGGQAVPACHGDSPAFLYRDGTLKQLFEPQHDADNPRLLISCLGGGSAAEYEENELVLQKGDLIVLCTDGICCQGRLKWLMRLSVSASTIAKLSTMGKYSDNATILLAKVEEL